MRTALPPIPTSRAVLAAAAAYFAFYLLWQVFDWGGDGAQSFIGNVAYWPVHAAGCWLSWRAARGSSSRRVRRAWLLFGAALAASFAGGIAQFMYEVVFDASPYPSLADVGYLAFYPLVLAAMLCFPQAGASGALKARILIDCATVAIGGCAVVWFVVLGPTTLGLSGSVLQSVFTMAYPGGDLIVIVGLATVLLRRSLPSSESALHLVGLGALLFVVGDLIFGYVTLHGSYTGGDGVDAVWMLAHLMFLLAADAQRIASRTAPDGESVPAQRERASWMPYVALAVLFGLLAYSERGDALVPGGILVGAAVASSALVSLRQFLAQRELVQAHEELAALATTDPLTGLSNHRALVSHLDRELERAARYRRTCAVLFVDLDHFKAINDSLGHAIGDRVLADLASLARQQLRTIDIVGRWGGEEFVILLPELERDAAMVVAERLRAAVAGHAFDGASGSHLTCSIGVASFPIDGIERDELLDRADRAMFAAKRLGRNQTVAANDPAVAILRAGPLSRDDEALMGAVEALAMMVNLRDRYTGAHPDDVSGLAIAVATALGCSEDEATSIGIAARLHDVGKVAVPDAILRKPAALDVNEWAIMRRHSGTGADIVSHIPRLRGIAKVIRGHHERWDGGGYPDGLAGTDIPLGARIVGAADAFHAMIADRPYRAAMTRATAVEHLRRDAGRHFDPAVVEALLLRILAERR